MWTDSLREFVSRLFKQWRRPRVEEEMTEELQFHIEQQTAMYIRRGMKPHAARRKARRQFGGVEQVREDARDTMRIVWLGDLWRDARLATRTLRRSLTFSVTVILVLGMAIGLSTTIFTFVQAILLSPLPYRQSERLVMLRSLNPNRELQLYGVSWPDLFDWRKQAESFEGIAAFRPLDCDLTDGTSTQRIQGMSITRNFFDVVGVPLALGRTFSEAEEETRYGSMILGHDLWSRRFRGDPGVIGRSQDVYSWTKYPKSGVSAWQIVGVSGFTVPFFPTQTDVGGRTPGINDQIEFWQPPWVYNDDDRSARYLFTAVARLKQGISVEQAAAEMRVISRRLAEEYPDTNRGWTVEVIPVEDLVTAEVRPALLVLSGAVAFLLFISCANVAGLLVVRGVARQQELAVRIALGAGRWRLVRQLVTETLLLCLAGGAVGVLFSLWSVGVVRSLAPPEIPRLAEVRVDLAVLYFALGLSLATGVFVGGFPALLSSTMDVNDTLKAGGRSASASKSQRRLMSGLIVGEIAVCLVLLTGAGLLIRSFASVVGIDPGFRTDRLLTMTVSLPQAKYEWKHNSDFCVELVTNLRAAPGVEAASAVRGIPTRETHFDCNVYIEGRPVEPKQEMPQGKARVVEPGFFETMQVPLLKGRLFEPVDSIGEIGYTRVTVCNETFAGRFFPGESPLGKRFSVIGPGEDPIEIVGVVGDVRFTGLAHEPHAEFYYPEALFPQSEFTLLVRTAGDPQTMMGTVERLIRETDPSVVVTSPNTMEEVISRSLSRERFLMLLLSTFSIGALVLSATGHYGVMSYSVSQRRRELGIRLALGATPGSVVRMVVAESLGLALIGLVVGFAASLAGGRLIASHLYGIEPTDPLTLAGAVAVMLSVSVLATVVPSIRGSRFEPAVVLRGD